MPPLPPPNTLAQLEEACRRLEEVSTKTTKPRYTDTGQSACQIVGIVDSELKFHPSPTRHCVSGGHGDIFQAAYPLWSFTGGGGGIPPSANRMEAQGGHVLKRNMSLHWILWLKTWC